MLCLGSSVENDELLTRKGKSFLRRIVVLYYSLPLIIAYMLGLGRRPLLNVLLEVFGKNVGEMDNRWHTPLLRSFAKYFSQNTDNYCLINMLPKTADRVSLSTLPTDTKESEFAIVLQGPIQVDFTPETIRIYKKLFPKATLIVSTWDDTDEELLEEIRPHATVIVNAAPKISGMMHLNYQIVSSRAGIQEALNRGISYAIKTRTDQRIYAPYALEYLKSLLEVFPLDERAQQWQKERIITAGGHRGTAYAPFWIKDFFYFGATSDLFNLFSLELDKRRQTYWNEYVERTLGKTLEELCIYNLSSTKIAEVYIAKNYLERFGDKSAGLTVRDFWQVVKRRFLIIDARDLRLFWNKYDKYIGCTGEGSDTDSYYDGNMTVRTESMAWGTHMCTAFLRGHILYDEKMEKYMEQNWISALRQEDQDDGKLQQENHPSQGLSPKD